MILFISRLRHRRIDRSESQAGYTLLELLVAMSITLLVIVPLMSWGILVMRQQPVERDGMMRTAQTGLLGSMFPSDVSVAGQAWVAGMDGLADCTGGASDKGSLQLTMITSGSTVQRVVYSVAKSSDDPGELSIWRRTCGVGSDNALIRESQLFKGVKPGSTAVTCSSSGGDAPCREIALLMTPSTTDQAIELTATRRVDNNGVSLDAIGNPMPVAAITLESRSAKQPMSAVFSGSRSTVGPGRTISYLWEFEDDVVVDDPAAERVTAQFPLLGAGESSRDFTVRLTVTDDLGRSNTALTLISSSNIDPIAYISSLTPNPVTVGETVRLSALPGSWDPDGAIVRFDWLITLPETGPDATPREVKLSGPTVSYTTKAGDAGVASVRLSVTDLQLGQATVSAPLTIVDPAAPSTTTTLPGGPVVAAFTDAPGAARLARSFDASTSTGLDTSTTFAWNFGDGTTGTGVTASHTYANAGTFNVSLTVTTGDGRSGTTTRAITVVSGALPAPTRVRHNGAYVLWDPVPGAKRYLVDFEFKTLTDCYRLIPNQAVGAGPNPSKQIPGNPCPSSATALARVGADSGESVSWSAWISVPAIKVPITTVPPPTTQPPVVK